MKTKGNYIVFAFLGTRLAQMNIEKKVISTHHNDVLRTLSRDLSGLAPCSHKEADKRIMFHGEDAVKQGHSKIMIRTV